MRKPVFMLILILSSTMILSTISSAAIKPIFKKDKKSILSNACVMSYTDVQEKITRVIRGNPITINLR